jgi:hypothetical protein
MISKPQKPLSLRLQSLSTSEFQSLCMFVETQPKISQSCGRMPQPLCTVTQALSGKAQ